MEPITQEACYFHDDHSLFDDEELQVRSLSCGKRIAAALGGNRAVILANHGLLTTGSAVSDAVAAFVVMERVAEAHLKAPGAEPISAESAAATKAGLRPEIAFGWIFDRLVESHLPDKAEVGTSG
jgi:ribulose-5-phosphate 4-epimerase/fuculose-1-phosphate aldolase